MSTVDPELAPLQYAIFEYIRKNCCMSASISVLKNEIDYDVTQYSNVASALQRIKNKGSIIHNNGRYHYYECENY